MGFSDNQPVILPAYITELRGTVVEPLVPRALLGFFGEDYTIVKLHQARRYVMVLTSDLIPVPDLGNPVVASDLTDKPYTLTIAEAAPSP